MTAQHQQIFDNWLKAIKQVGFPVCVASALLYALWPAFDEQVAIMRAARMGIEKNADVAASNANSLSKLTTCQESQTKCQESQARTLNRVCKVLESLVPETKSQPIVVQPRDEQKNGGG